jgi:hypothetical protein
MNNEPLGAPLNRFRWLERKSRWATPPARIGTSETKNWCPTPQEPFHISWEFLPPQKGTRPKNSRATQNAPALSHFCMWTWTDRGLSEGKSKLFIPFQKTTYDTSSFHLSVCALSTACHPLKGLILVVSRPHTQSSGLSYSRTHTKTPFDTSSTHLFVYTLPLHPLTSTPPPERDPERPIWGFT